LWIIHSIILDILDKIQKKKKENLTKTKTTLKVTVHSIIPIIPSSLSFSENLGIIDPRVLALG